MTHHQYGQISVLVLLSSFREKTFSSVKKYWLCCQPIVFKNKLKKVQIDTGYFAVPSFFCDFHQEGGLSLNTIIPLILKSYYGSFVRFMAGDILLLVV